MSKLDEAKAAVAELLENAKVGNIIPVRLPGQIESIYTLLEEAEAEHHEQVEQLKNRPGGDSGDLVIEQAEFMKTAVHDLKNPLASIKGYGDLLKNPAMAGELSDMQMQLLEVIRTNTQRMEGLLADIGVVNKLRTGMLVLDSKMDTFKNIAMTIEKQTQPLAEDLNRQLVFDIPQGLPILQTDGEKLADAIVKLVENGLRYSPEGEGQVVVSAEGDNGTLLIHVSDNGVGMNDAEVARLGEMFWRADNDLVRSYKGSGLGIPIAFGLIDLMGGKIDVSSQPDEGTTFTIAIEGMS